MGYVIIQSNTDGPSAMEHDSEQELESERVRRGRRGRDSPAFHPVQGPAVSALPLSLALKAAALGDGVALEQLFRKLESGEIDAGDIL